MLLSIVVCTYNRADMLATVLENLAGQTLSPDEFEILIVDNNSTDDTARIAQEFCAKYPHFHYFLEKNIGLSHARNRGLAEARGVYVGYTDDDCRIPADWLEKAHRIATEHAPAIFGGPWLPFYTVPKPYWYLDKYDTYMDGKYPTCAEYFQGKFVTGANIFILRTALISCGGFDTNLGMQGGNLGYHEEIELQRRILAAIPGERIFFDPELHLKHWVRPEKMNLLWRFKQQHAVARAKALLGSRDERQSKLTISLIIKLLIRPLIESIHVICIIPFRNKTAYPFVQNYVYEVVAPVLRKQIYGFYLLYFLRRAKES
jgi:glycosyltransferase involved in cell wall biosynthesis